MCVTVVQWSRSCLDVQINRVRLLGRRFSVSLYRFFFCLVSFFQHYFFFSPFFLYPYRWPCWSCTWINIYFSPEFYFGRGISKALDLHKLSRHVPPLKQLNLFFNVSWNRDKQHTVHHKIKGVCPIQYENAVKQQDSMLTVSHKYLSFSFLIEPAKAERTLRGVIWGSISSEELKIRTI